MVKNESDIIGLNIEHHINQGISQFIVTDNASTDNTRQIIEKYPEVIEIIDEPGDNHHQSKWVTRMAQLACKLNPDWIIHLDADELWGNLYQLRSIHSQVASCECMYLHPPIGDFNLHNQRYYLNFDHCNIPQEAKVAHRPDPDIQIAHGNHSVIDKSAEFTNKIYRHHYPIRSYEQWARKAAGNESLKKRNAYCPRWEQWYNMLLDNTLRQEYERLTILWKECIRDELTHERFMSLVKFWATPEMIRFFMENPVLPEIQYSQH